MLLGQVWGIGESRSGLGWNPASNSEEGGREGGREGVVARGGIGPDVMLPLSDGYKNVANPGQFFMI